MRGAVRAWSLHLSKTNGIMLEDNLVARVAILLAAILGRMLVAVSARLRAKRSGSASMSAPAGSASASGAPAAGDGVPVPFRDPVIESLSLAVFRRAFGATNFNYTILGEHEGVIAR